MCNSPFLKDDIAIKRRYSMKLMFISDIHGSVTSLDQALDRFKEEKADYLVISGDILYHGPRNPLPDGYEPEAVIQLLNPLKNKIIAVRGNCDSEVDQMVLDFPIMADFQQFFIDGHRFFISHGHLFNNELPDILEEENVYVQGHTHIPMLKKVQTKTHFNPGSITLPKNNEPKTYGLYDDHLLYIKKMDGSIYLKANL